MKTEVNISPIPNKWRAERAVFINVHCTLCSLFTHLSILSTHLGHKYNLRSTTIYTQCRQLLDKRDALQIQPKSKLAMRLFSLRKRMWSSFSGDNPQQSLLEAITRCSSFFILLPEPASFDYTASSVGLK